MRLIISKAVPGLKEPGSPDAQRGWHSPAGRASVGAVWLRLLAPAMGSGGSLPLISICSPWQPQRGKDGARRWDDASGDGGDAVWNDQPRFIFAPECFSRFLPGCSPDRCGSSSLDVWASPRGAPAHRSYKARWWFVGPLYLMVLPTGCRPQPRHYVRAGADTHVMDISISLITWRPPQ